MSTPAVQRKLAAILAADVAGYSRLVGADEEGTIERLRALRRELIDPTIAAHRGRIVKTTGDGILIEFASVVDDVRCAVQVQGAMASHNMDIPADKRIELRVGVNLGDVVVDGDDLLGDGVNVAARLEGIAEPGAICGRLYTRAALKDIFGAFQQSTAKVRCSIGYYDIDHAADLDAIYLSSIKEITIWADATDPADRSNATLWVRRDYCALSAFDDHGTTMLSLAGQVRGVLLHLKRSIVRPFRIIAAAGFGAAACLASKIGELSPVRAKNILHEFDYGITFGGHFEFVFITQTISKSGPRHVEYRFGVAVEPSSVVSYHLSPKWPP